MSMRMKRLSALLLSFLLILGLLSACSKQESGTTGTSQEPAETSSTLSPESTKDNEPESTQEVTQEPTSETAWDPDNEYFLEPEEGMKQLTLYWNRENTDYSKADVWIWFPDKDGQGYLFYPCEYGVKCMVNIPEDIDSVGFIVRYNCSDPGGKSWGEATKDYDGDRFADVSGGDTEIYLVSGDENQYSSEDGGKTLITESVLKSAAIISMNEIRYFITPATALSDAGQIHIEKDGEAVEIEKVSNLNNQVVTGVVTLKEEVDLTASYTVEIDGFTEGVTAFPGSVFDCDEFAEKYHYDGDDLGAVVNGDNTVFKVWAPTAKEVILNLFEEGDSGEAYEKLPMERADKGIFTLETAAPYGTYYTYTVTTAMGTQEAVDPYAKATGVNGNRGMVVDLMATDPEGFTHTPYDPGFMSYEDAVIWEVHVRDFSNQENGTAYPGKYLAFTETGLKNESGEAIGIDYLKDLGITHIHLQPVYDYATVDESSDKAQFNWGYDPKNYNVPEGSYSTDPYHGEVRINEFKQMVQSLHENGIGVIMDVVYNHTYDANSCLNRIVPYYYYRYTSSGENSNGSGCGNETASERYMFRKYMVDSVSYWQEEYQVDGFRFDLMALHDTETMQAIETAVHTANPQALIYGEGWTGGTTPLNPNIQMTQNNSKQVKRTEGAIGSIAVFNDEIRDGLKGSVFDAKDRAYINGKASKTSAAKITFSLAGGLKSAGVSWSVNDAMVVNYMSCHDNNTLWDKLEISCPEASEEKRLAMNRLGASIVMLSKGMPFMLAGEEFLRTKGGDSNSYMSPDLVNNLEWEKITPDSDEKAMSEFYETLIDLRKDNAFLRDPEVTVTTEILKDLSISVLWEKDEKVLGAALINPTGEETETELPEGNFTLLLYDNDEAEEAVTGTLKAQGMSVSFAVAAE